MSVYDDLASILRKAQGSITEDGGVIDVGREVVMLRSAYEEQKARIAALEADAANLIKAHNEMHTAAQNHIAELEEQLLSAKTLAGVFDADNQRLRDGIMLARRMYIDNLGVLLGGGE